MLVAPSDRYGGVTADQGARHHAPENARAKSYSIGLIKREAQHVAPVLARVSFESIADYICRKLQGYERTRPDKPLL